MEALGLLPRALHSDLSSRISPGGAHLSAHAGHGRLEVAVVNLFARVHKVLSVPKTVRAAGQKKLGQGLQQRDNKLPASSRPAVHS